MLQADQAPYFHTCPRCGIGGLEKLQTHAFCVNCNYEEIYSDELCVIPQWALDALKPAKKLSVRAPQPTGKKSGSTESVPIAAQTKNFDGSAA